MLIYITFIVLLLSFLLYIVYNPKKKKNKDLYHNPIEIPLLSLDDALKFMNSIPQENYNFGSIRKSVRFIPGTITTDIKNKVSCIIQPLVSTLNKLSKKDFIIMEYNTILIDLDIDNNFKLGLDFFINSIKDNKRLRLVAEIIVDNLDNKYLNYMNKYNNSELDLSILDKTSLENSAVKNYKNLRVNNWMLRNKWIPPKGNTNNKPFPCNKLYNIWDNNGINYVERCSKGCYGINSAPGVRSILPKWNPTLHTLPRDNLGLLGLFDLAVGMPGSNAHSRTTTIHRA